MTRSSNPFRYFDPSPEVIRLVVMMYVKYPLSLRNVEDLLFERAVADCCSRRVGALLDRENFVASKLSWQRQLLVDPNLTPFAKVFGSYLMHDLHPGKGGAWRSQSSLAELLAVDLRTIRRAAAAPPTAAY